MKCSLRLLAACLGAALLAVAGWAQTAPVPVAGRPPQSPAAVKLPGPPTVTGPSKVGTINIREAITATAEGKKLLAGVQARFAPKNTDLKNTQAQIAALTKKLQDGKSTMSAAAQQELSREIQAHQRDFNQTTQDDESDLQNAQTGVLNTVGNKMMPILEAYAKAHGYTAIVDVSFGWPQSPVLYYNPGTDITGAIVKLYDQKYPAAATSPGNGNR